MPGFWLFFFVVVVIVFFFCVFVLILALSLLWETCLFLPFFCFVFLLNAWNERAYFKLQRADPDLMHLTVLYGLLSASAGGGGREGRGVGWRERDFFYPLNDCIYEDEG